MTISFYWVLNKHILILDDSRQYFSFFKSDINNIEWRFKIPNTNVSFITIDNQSIIIFVDNQSIVINASTGESYSLNEIILLKMNKFYSAYIDIKKPTQIIFSINDVDTKKTLEYGNINKFFEHYMVIGKDANIQIIDIFNNTWSFDFTEHSEWNDPINGLIDGDVGEIFHVSEDFFVVLSHRWKLTAFRIIDGAILWEHSFNNTLPLIYSYSQNSFHVFSDMYYSIDATTGQVLVQYDFRTIFNENGLRTYWLTNPAVNDTFIAVTSHYDNSIIIINRKDFSIAQIIKLDKSKLGVPLPNKPVFLENKLLQLDGENNLYVFGTP